MNELAREVFVKAALAQHEQIHMAWHNYLDKAGECAMGLLHLEMHETRKQALVCFYTAGSRIKCIPRLMRKFGLSQRDCGEIARRNDRGEDWITIARKSCLEPSQD